MTLLTEHLEAGWHEVETGGFGKWVAEKYHSRPGATASTIRVEAESSKKLQDAVTLRESQLTGTEERVKDTITNDGTLVTGEQHEALKTEGLAVPGAEQVVDTPPTPDSDVPAVAAPSETPESQSTQSGEADPSRAGEPAADSASTSERTSSTGDRSPEQISNDSTTTTEPSGDVEGGVTPTDVPAAEATSNTEVQPASTDSVTGGDNSPSAPQVIAPGTTTNEPVPSTAELTSEDVKVVEGGVVAASGQKDTETAKATEEGSLGPAASQE